MSCSEKRLRVASSLKLSFKISLAKFRPTETLAMLSRRESKTHLRLCKVSLNSSSKSFVKLTKAKSKQCVTGIESSLNWQRRGSQLSKEQFKKKLKTESRNQMLLYLRQRMTCKTCRRNSMRSARREQIGRKTCFRHLTMRSISLERR